MTPTVFSWSVKKSYLPAPWCKALSKRNTRRFKRSRRTILFDCERTDKCKPCFSSLTAKSRKTESLPSVLTRIPVLPSSKQGHISHWVKWNRMRNYIVIIRLECPFIIYVIVGVPWLKKPWRNLWSGEGDYKRLQSAVCLIISAQSWSNFWTHFSF